MSAILRQALRGRWAAATLGIVVVAITCIRLGFWQLDRLDQRRDFNHVVEARGALPPSNVAELARPGTDGIGDFEYRRVVATGTYDDDHEMLVLSKTLQGTPGQHVLTPLLLEDGSAILVERGFVPVSNPEAVVPSEARAPGGPAEVEGVLRNSEEGGRFLAADAKTAGQGTIAHVTRVDVDRIARELPYDLRPGYVRVEAELAEAAGQVPTPLLPPAPGEGPHLGYAFQWFSFAGVFTVGWAVLCRRAAGGRRQPKATTESRAAGFVSR